MFISRLCEKRNVSGGYTGESGGYTEFFEKPHEGWLLGPAIARENNINKKIYIFSVYRIQNYDWKYLSYYSEFIDYNTF